MTVGATEDDYKEVPEQFYASSRLTVRKDQCLMLDMAARRVLR